MSNDEGFILIDNEDGIWSERNVAVRLIDEWLDYPLWPLSADVRFNLTRQIAQIDTMTPEEDREQGYIELQNDIMDTMSASCSAGFMVGLVEDRCGVIAYQKIEDENVYTPACLTCYDMGFKRKDHEDGPDAEPYDEIVACTCAAKLYSDQAAFNRWRSMTQNFMWCNLVAATSRGHEHIAGSYFNPHQIIPLLQEVPFTARRGVHFEWDGMLACTAVVH